MRDAFRNASKEASIPYGQQVEGGWTVHDLRRTHLTGLLQSGVDLATVRDLAGHHSITVSSRYVRSTPSSRRNAVTAAENLVRFAPTLQVHRGKKETGEQSTRPVRAMKLSNLQAHCWPQTANLAHLSLPRLRSVVQHNAFVVVLLCFSWYSFVVFLNVTW